MQTEIKGRDKEKINPCDEAKIIKSQQINSV